MKTIRQWLNDLPEPHRTRALAHLDKETDGCDTLKAISLSDAIPQAFLWSKTPEGHAYWRSIAQEDFDAVPATVVISEVERYRYALDQIGFYFAGTENHHITEIVQRVLNGESMQDIRKSNTTQTPS